MITPKTRESISITPESYQVIQTLRTKIAEILLDLDRKDYRKGRGMDKKLFEYGIQHVSIV